MGFVEKASLEKPLASRAQVEVGGGGARGCPEGALEGIVPERVLQARAQALEPAPACKLPDGHLWRPSPEKVKDAKPTRSKEHISRDGHVTLANWLVGGHLGGERTAPTLPGFAPGWTKLCAHGALPPVSPPFTLETPLAQPSQRSSGG